MNEAELAEYCRGKGLFVEQVADWREACQEANAAPASATASYASKAKATALMLFWKAPASRVASGNRPAAALSASSYYGFARSRLNSLIALVKGSK